MDNIQDKVVEGNCTFHQVYCDNHVYVLATLTATGQKPVKWWQCKNCGKHLLPSNLQNIKKNGTN